VPIAGSPLPPEGYDYVYEHLGPDVLLLNGSGGTDVCSAIVSGSALQPVHRGEMAGRWLGVDATAFDLDDALRQRITTNLRTHLSPRHVPDMIAAVPAIPRTLTGKKLEAPVKRILRGEPADAVASQGALAAPDAIDAFVRFAQGTRRA
jgi:acyl-coenzyme A synthetase/AMP-(fatty) acid ligase